MPDYSEFESAADLCGGQQIDKTPLLNTKASARPAKNIAEADDQNHQKENQSMTSVNDPNQARPIDDVLDDMGITNPEQRAEVAALFTPASPVDCIDGTVYAITVNATWKTVTATIAGPDPDKPTHVLFDTSDLRALADALTDLEPQEEGQ